MPVYLHFCKVCKMEFTSGDPETSRCPLGHTQPHYPDSVVRRFSFSIAKEMEGGYNHALGSYVSNRREYLDGLKRASDEASENTGMEHRYVPVDMAELAKSQPEA